MAGMEGTYDDIKVRLEDVSEQLGDRIMVLLREALETGAPGRPPEEKVLSRARAAVDRAVGLLGQLDEPAGD